MSRGAFLAVVFALSALASASAIDERNWSRVWGAIEYDEVGDVAVADDGSIYSVGRATGAFDGQTIPDTKAGVLTAHDADGNKLWTRIFGATNALLAAHGVAVDSGGRVYVTGQTWDSFDGQPEIGNGDFYVKVFDAAGSSVWTRIWGSTSIDQGNALSPRAPAAGGRNRDYPGLPLKLGDLLRRQLSHARRRFQ